MKTAILTVLILASTASADTFKVIKIIDGDTIDVLTPKRGTVRLRLNGIDAPETGQPYGKNAKERQRMAEQGHRRQDGSGHSH